jgi:hypothetical protein
MASSLRDHVVEGPNSVGQRMRVRRWNWLHEQFPDIESMSVIDLGGTAQAWMRAPVRPSTVHVVNLERVEPVVPWIRADQADACNLPDYITSGTYDLVFSNSVLEHVGGHSQRMRFAESVHKLANCHWVQTPYRYFPIEPHWLFPGFQFLPFTIRAEIVRRWPLVPAKASSHKQGLDAALEVELVSRAEMSYYFPSSNIYSERLAGLPKSLVAIKKA